MKIYLSDFNNILVDVKEKLSSTNEFVKNPREADIFVLWQDVRRDMAELCRINKEHMKKPVVVVQHGRGATRDYLKPNNFPMYADVFCCWGIKDKERLDKAGYGDRAVITGSPLINKIKNKIIFDENNVIFCPVITLHEEPENIITFLELKKIEYKKAQDVLKKNFEQLKDEWSSKCVGGDTLSEKVIPYYNINKSWRVISKITSAHDKKLYFGDIVHTIQQNKTHIDDGIKLLTMASVVVGMEEGTYQLLAMAMDIPVVMVNGFSYKNFGGIDYSEVEMIKTNAAHWVELSDIEYAVDQAYNDSGRLKKEREIVVSEELGDIHSDPTEKIVEVINSYR